MTTMAESHRTPPAGAHPSQIALLPVVGEVTRPIYEGLRGFANSNASILIRGATGVGKSRLARWIHAQSPRAGAPFVEAELVGTPGDMVASALYGHRKGAFTNAHETRSGRLREADRGTLFLDEIDKLGLQEQSALLRVLDEGCWRELGGTSQHADIRFIAGTNANLEREIRARRFREDLYYRINAIPVFLPPLDERRDEIVPWARWMLDDLHSRHGNNHHPARLDRDLEMVLESRRWPGNLRQLRHIVERTYIIARCTDESDELVLQRPHLETAFQLDRPEELKRTVDLHRQVVEHLDAAARLGAHLVLHRESQGMNAMPLHLWEGFAGMVLDAVGRHRTLDKGSTSLFGLEGQVVGSNYRKTYQRLQRRGMDLIQSIQESMK